MPMFSIAPLYLTVLSPVDGVGEQKIIFDPNFGVGDTSLEDTGNEAFTTIKCLAQEIPELNADLEIIQKLKSVNIQNFHDTFELCQLYNTKISALKLMWKRTGFHSKYFSQRAGGALLRHILRQCYERSVDHPASLNSYPPFSSAVYGETSFELVERVIDMISISPDDCFIDLGSGVGQVVLQVAASTDVKIARGIEKADYPALCASRMLIEFQSLMRFYGKIHQAVELEKSDFLCEENRDKILQSNIVFVNNYAFGPDVDLQLMERFKHLNEHSKIISSKSYRPRNFRITDRNLCDLASILRSEELPPMKVSWTSTNLSYTLHTVDRSLLEEYFTSVRLPKPPRRSNSTRTPNNRNNSKVLMRSVSANHVKEDGSIGSSKSSNNKWRRHHRHRSRQSLSQPGSLHSNQQSQQSPSVTTMFHIEGGGSSSSTSGGGCVGGGGGSVDVITTTTITTNNNVNGRNNMININNTTSESTSETTPSSHRIDSSTTLSSPSNAWLSISTNSTPETLPLSQGSTPNNYRKRRPALSMAQAALERIHSKRPRANTNSSSLSNVPAAPGAGIGGGGDSVFYSPANQSNLSETVLADSTCCVNTDCSSTPTNAHHPHHHHTYKARRRQTESSPSTFVGYHDENDFIRRHNLSILHEDMLLSLQSSSNEDHQQQQQQLLPEHHVFALNNVKNELLSQTKMHSAFLQSRQCTSLPVEQFLEMMRQCFLDFQQKYSSSLTTIPSRHPPPLPPPLPQTSPSSSSALPTTSTSISQQILLKLQKELQSERDKQTLLHGLLSDTQNVVSHWRQCSSLKLMEILHKMKLPLESKIVDFIQKLSFSQCYQQLLHKHVSELQQDVHQLKKHYKKLKKMLIGCRNCEEILRMKMMRKMETNATKTTTMEKRRRRRRRRNGKQSAADWDEEEHEDLNEEEEDDDDEEENDEDDEDDDNNKMPELLPCETEIGGRTDPNYGLLPTLAPVYSPISDDYSHPPSYPMASSSSLPIQTQQPSSSPFSIPPVSTLQYNTNKNISSAVLHDNKTQNRMLNFTAFPPTHSNPTAHPFHQHHHHHQQQQQHLSSSPTKATILQEPSSIESHRPSVNLGSDDSRWRVQEWLARSCSDPIVPQQPLHQVPPLMNYQPINVSSSSPSILPTMVGQPPPPNPLPPPPHHHHHHFPTEMHFVEHFDDNNKTNLPPRERWRTAHTSWRCSQGSQSRP